MRFIVVCLYLLLIFASQAQAVAIKNIYTTQVEVYQETGFDKKQVFLAGLEKVVFKLTGINNVFKDRRLIPLRNISNTLVQKFTIKKLTTLERRQWREHFVALHARSPEQTPYSIVTVSYAKKPISSYLKRNKIPFWSAIRPKSVYWVVENIDDKLQIVKQTGNSSVKAMLADITEAIGLPVSYPILDELDMQRISVSMLKDSDINTVSLATQRYQAFNTVIVDISLIEDTYNINWTAKIDDLTYVWDSTSTNLYQALQLGVVENVSYILATINEGIELDRYHPIKINVDNIVNYPSMEKISKYLYNLPKLSDVKLKQVSPNNIVFEAKLVGTINNLKRYIRLQNIVEINETEDFSVDIDEPLLLDESLQVTEQALDPDEVLELNLHYK